MRTAVFSALVLACLPVGAVAQLSIWPEPLKAPGEYVAMLGTLDPSRVESVTAARQAFEHGASRWPPDQAEDAFRAFWRFYRAVVRHHDPAIDKPEAVELLFRLCSDHACGDSHYILRALERSRSTVVSDALAANSTLLAGARTTRAHGVEILLAEGNLYRAESADLLSSLADRLPAGPFRGFVEFYARELTVWVADASIVIPWPALADRLARWEDFRRAHGELPESRAVVEPEVRRLREFYLCGVSNTPVFWYEQPRRIEHAALASFQEFARLHARSETAPIVTAYLAELSRSGGVLDAGVSAFAARALNNARTGCRSR